MRRLIQEGAIEFYNRGIVFSDDPMDRSPIRSSLEQINAISIEIWLKAAKEPQNAILNFLCLDGHKFPPSIALGQRQSSLVIRTADEYGGLKKQGNEVKLQNAMPQGEKRFFTITSGQKGTTIYLDGKKAGFFPGRRLLSHKETLPPSFLVLGNNPKGKKPWNGKVFGLSIYDQELSETSVLQNYRLWTHGDYSKLSRQAGIIALYPMDEPNGHWIHNRLADRDHLWIPDKFRIPKPPVLIPPWKDEGFKKYQDIVINILGFIPFGFFCLAYFSSIQRPPKTSARLLLIVVLFGSFVSLTIELLQVYSPLRYSSLTDLICNISGTAGGAFLYHLALRKSQKLNYIRSEAQ